MHLCACAFSEKNVGSVYENQVVEISQHLAKFRLLNNWIQLVKFKVRLIAVLKKYIWPPLPARTTCLQSACADTVTGTMRACTLLEKFDAAC